VLSTRFVLICVGFFSVRKGSEVIEEMKNQGNFLLWLRSFSN